MFHVSFIKEILLFETYFRKPFQKTSETTKDETNENTLSPYNTDYHNSFV